MFLLKVLILFIFSLNTFASDNYIDSLTLTKIKKLVQKEEEIAFAYKKYILVEGFEPASISTLKTSTDYLPGNFNTSNYFGGNIDFSTNTNKLKSFTSTDNDLKSNIYDYYYSNKYRTYTKAPFSTNNNDIEIVLSPKEKFIYANKDKITTTITVAKETVSGKYYLDSKGVLHWYEGNKYKFSVDKDLIVNADVLIINDNKIINDDYKEMVKDVTYSGQTIIQKNNANTANVYIGIDENTIIRQNPDSKKDIQLILIGKNSGGMIVNGDIYTWGNNENRITGINIDSYTKDSAQNGTKSAVITTLVRAKAKMYDDDLTDEKNLTDFYNQNYFSSPLRPRFIDLFTSTKHGTCGVSTKGELYCGGLTANNTDSINTFVDTSPSTTPSEMLYRSKYFDGKVESPKASKIFANNQLWLILSEEGDIYRWGYEDTNKNGFSGNGTSTYNSNTNCTNVCTNWEWQKIRGSWYYVCITEERQCTGLNINKLPEKIMENISTEVKFKDISNTLSNGYKKMVSLSTTGDLYLWGMDEQIANVPTCSVTWEGSTFNLCQATKITTSNSNILPDLTFESIQSGLRSIIALGSNGKYYKIDHPKDKKIQVTYLMDKTNILSIDLVRDLTSSDPHKSIVVYVSLDNKLVSSYFDSLSFDDIFRNTIASMLWKSVKVLEDANAMCGMNTDNQMYCWGTQTYLDSTNPENNTFMLPVFNTNLFDINKDYLIAEGGDSNTLTTMTSGTWLNNNNFYIKYPTYIGGFNYEFIFK